MPNPLQAVTKASPAGDRVRPWRHEAESVAPARRSPAVARGSRAAPAVQVGLALALALLPKCPICWAAYLSVFGMVGAAWAHSLTGVSLALVLIVHLLIALRRAPQAGYAPLGFAIAGALSLLGARVDGPWSGWLGFAGLSLIVAGTLWYTLSLKHAQPLLPH